MAHSPQTQDLQDLSPEILDMIVRRCGKPSLKTLRLTSKPLGGLAAPALFGDIFVSPSKSDFKRWRSITQEDSLARLVHHITLQTHRDVDVYPQEDYYSSDEDEGKEDENEDKKEDDEDGEDDEEDEEEDDDDPIGGDENAQKRFREVASSLDRLPSLNSLQVTFTSSCLGRRGDDQWWAEITESSTTRVAILRFIYAAIRARKAHSIIRSLTIDNLQNRPSDEFTASADFKAVMSQLDELHLGFINEYNEHGPDHDYNCEELRTFPEHLWSQWLAPIAPNLRALSLYQSKGENWGPFPGPFPPVSATYPSYSPFSSSPSSSILFPHLHTLNLGYYTIAHDAQLDWVLAQKSLRRLVFHNCMIASDIRITAENMDEWRPFHSLDDDGKGNNNVMTCDWAQIPRAPGTPRYAGDSGEYRYATTWAYFFDRIAAELPELREFVFDYHSASRSSRYGVSGGSRRCRGRDSSWRGRRDDDDVWTGVGGGGGGGSGGRLFAERYVVFDDGILPTHWPEADRETGEMRYTFWEAENADMKRNFHKDNLEEDRKSLENLWEKCREREARSL